MRALCAGFFRRPRRGRRAARTRPRVVRCGGREAHPRKARPQMSAAAGSPRKALCSVSAPLQPAPPHSSAGGRTRRAWRRGLEHAAGGARTRRGSRGVHLACSSAALRLGLCPLRVLLPADEGPCLSPSSPAASFSFSSPFFNFRTCSERTSQKDWCLYPDYETAETVNQILAAFPVTPCSHYLQSLHSSSITSFLSPLPLSLSLCLSVSVPVSVSVSFSFSVPLSILFLSLSLSGCSPSPSFSLYLFLFRLLLSSLSSLFSLSPLLISTLEKRVIVCVRVCTRGRRERESEKDQLK